MGHLHRLIAFDLDGTVVDSRCDLARSANELIVEFGGSELSEDVIGRMVGEGAAVLVDRALTEAGVVNDPRALPRFLEIYDRRLLDHTRAYPGIADAIRAARRNSRVSVLTNKPVTPSERILEGLGLRELFDDVIGGDGPFPRKPHPAGLLALIERAGVTPAGALLIGDSRIDHETARNAGVQCCLATYGFGYETFPADRLDGKEWIAVEPGDVAGFVERFTAGA